MDHDDEPEFILPPLPPLTWDAYAWDGRMSLPSWARIDICLSDETPALHAPKSNGRVGLAIKPADDAQRFPPTAEQIAAYEHLVANDRWICAAALAAIYEIYEGERQTFLGYCDDGLEHLVPPIDSAAGLRQLVCLHTVHILPISKDGCAYVGLELGCTWEDEHGLGLMLHKNRVLAVGQAEVSFREHVCEDDGGTPLSAPPGWGEPPPPVHPGDAIDVADAEDARVEFELTAGTPSARPDEREDAIDIGPWLDSDEPS